MDRVHLALYNVSAQFEIETVGTHTVGVERVRVYESIKWCVTAVTHEMLGRVRDKATRFTTGGQIRDVASDLNMKRFWFGLAMDVK